MSDWSTRDQVTLPNSKWRQYLHRLFIPVERRLIAAYIWVANAYTDILEWPGLFTILFHLFLWDSSLRCSRFGPFTGFNFGLVSRRTTIFLIKAGSLERTAFVHSSMQRRNKTLWVLWNCLDTWKLFYYYFFFTEKIKQNYVFSSKTF